MSDNYKGVGTLKHIVKESNEDRQRLKEGGEYFKNHTFQKRNDPKHDLDFKTTADSKGITSVDDRMLDKDTEKVVDKLGKNEVEGHKDEYETKDTYGLDGYLDDPKAKEPKTEKEDASKNVKMGTYSEAWYNQLKGYMRKV